MLGGFNRQVDDIFNLWTFTLLKFSSEFGLYPTSATHFSGHTWDRAT